jgi:hypothetical protein
MTTIWKHGDSLRDLEFLKRRAYVDTCPHCRTTLTNLKDNDEYDNPPRIMGNFNRTQMVVRACLLCGWWKINSTETVSVSTSIRTYSYAAIATLRNLDLMDNMVPVQEIQS